MVNIFEAFIETIKMKQNVFFKAKKYTFASLFDFYVLICSWEICGNRMQSSNNRIKVNGGHLSSPRKL